MRGVGGGGVMMAGADTQTGEAPRGDAVTVGARARGEGGGEGGQGGAGAWGHRHRVWGEEALTWLGNTCQRVVVTMMVEGRGDGSSV